MSDAERIVKDMREAGLDVSCWMTTVDGTKPDYPEAGLWADVRGDFDAWTRFRGVPLDEVEAIEKALREYSATQKEWADKGVSIPPPSVMTGYFKLEKLADRLRRLRGGDV